MSLDETFLRAAAYGRVTEIVHFISLFVNGESENRYGPTRLSDLGSEVGKLLFTHGVPRLENDYEGLEANVNMAVLEEYGDATFEAQARLARSDGRNELRFSDGTFVVLSSLAHEANRGQSILNPGVTFRGESGARYVTGQMIGAGGTARVYEVRNQRGERFAAKCLSSERFDLDELQPRFEREIRHLRRAQHQHIIPYVDEAYRRENQILVMALAKETMATRLLRCNPDEKTALKWLGEVLEGVAHIHTLGLVHRDITPKNLMFADDGIWKLSDFGTVRDDDDADFTSDVAGVRLGSLIYISDQQRQNPHDVQPADDVFSIGQIAYLLLTSLSPQGNPPPLSTFSAIPEEVVEVIERMRSYRREERFEDASAALEALRVAV